MSYLNASPAVAANLDGMAILRVPGAPIAALKNKSKWVVFEVEGREIVTQLTAKEVHGWLCRTEADRLREIGYAAEARARRVEAVHGYLAARARRAPAPVQIELF